MENPEGLLKELLLKFDDDDTYLSWVLSIVIKYVKDETELKSHTLEIIRDLLARGLVACGMPKISKGNVYTFEAWEGSPQEVVGKIDAEWSKLKRRLTIGDVVWLRLTKKGKEKLQNLMELEKFDR